MYVFIWSRNVVFYSMMLGVVTQTCSWNKSYRKCCNPDKKRRNNTTICRTEAGTWSGFKISNTHRVSSLSFSPSHISSVLFFKNHFLLWRSLSSFISQYIQSMVNAQTAYQQFVCTKPWCPLHPTPVMMDEPLNLFSSTFLPLLSHSVLFFTTFFLFLLFLPPGFFSSFLSLLISSPLLSFVLFFFPERLCPSTLIYLFLFLSDLIHSLYLSLPPTFPVTSSLSCLPLHFFYPPTLSFYLPLFPFSISSLHVSFSLHPTLCLFPPTLTLLTTCLSLRPL